MGLQDFILNGGLLGKLRNFDYKAEGRPYGFSEFNEDITQVSDSLEITAQELMNVNSIINSYPLQTQLEEGVY